MRIENLDCSNINYNKLTVIVVVSVLSYISLWSADGALSLNSSCINSKCSVSISSSLASILSAVSIAIFLLSYTFPKAIHDNIESVGVWRRFGAFYIDFFIIILVLTPVLGLPILLVEYFYTGVFEFSFERQTSRWSDMPIILASTVIMFAGMFIYFYVFPYKNRQTLGQYLLNYKIIDSSVEGEFPDFKGRVIYAAIGMCTWPFALASYYSSKNSDKKFWWDNKSNTKAVRVDYS